MINLHDRVFALVEPYGFQWGIVIGLHDEQVKIVHTALCENQFAWVARRLVLTQEKATSLREELE